MRIDKTDLDFMSTTMHGMSDQIHGHIDNLFNYLMPAEQERTDFSDRSLHLTAAYQTAQILDVLASLQALAMWVIAAKSVIETKGDDATMEEVVTLLTKSLIDRTVMVGRASTAGPVAEYYFQQVLRNVGIHVAAGNKLVDADAKILRIIADHVAPALNLSPDECYERGRAGDAVIGDMVHEYYASEVETDMKARGLNIPAGLADLLHGRAGNGEGMHSDVAANIAGGLGIDAGSVTEIGDGVFMADLDGSAFHPPGSEATAVQDHVKV